MTTDRPSVVPQAWPKRNYLAHKTEIDSAIERVLDSGSYILGSEVTGFEEAFAAYVGQQYAVGVASGTDALELALRAAGIKTGDVVITVAHTASATVAAIERSGAIPAFVDIDPGTYTLDCEQLQAALRSNLDDRNWTTPGPITGIVPVHLYGNPADMSGVMDLASRYGLSVIEDCAQAHGASLRGRKVGTFGRAAAFSFYPTKNLGAIGDGGIVITDDSGIAARLRVLRQYGWRERYVSDEVGVNSRLDEVQAAILRVKLKYLDEENRKRQEIASVYTSALACTELVLPTVAGGSSHVFHQYVVRSKQRATLQVELDRAGIGTAIHYPVPIHMQPAYRTRALFWDDLTHTEQAAREVLSLPVYPELELHQADRIAKLIARC